MSRHNLGTGQSRRGGGYGQPYQEQGNQIAPAPWRTPEVLLRTLIVWMSEDGKGHFCQHGERILFELSRYNFEQISEAMSTVSVDNVAGPHVTGTFGASTAASTGQTRSAASDHLYLPTSISQHRGYGFQDHQGQSFNQPHHFFSGYVVS